MKKGFSIIEIIVVIGLFSVLATVASQATILSLRGARKSDASSEVRENLDFTVSVMERQLRNSRSIASGCDGSTLQYIDYIDQSDTFTSFECKDVGLNGFVASDSARLTSSEISITDCQFVCNSASAGLPPSIDIKITASNKNASGVESSEVGVDTRIMLRVY